MQACGFPRHEFFMTKRQKDRKVICLAWDFALTVHIYGGCQEHP